jgi:hypothetical protein
LSAHRIRYVQLARRGLLQEDGIVVLDDSRTPTHLYIDGAFKLSDELLATGTVPQVANRRCSQKFKGWPIDTWLARNIRGPFRQVMGFNADERKRIERDGCYGGSNRKAEYPLMAWGWGRRQCEDYLRDTFGVAWPKSCCSFCPFMGGKPQAMARYALHPEQAAGALYLEHLSLALNPRMTLYSGESLREALTDEAALALFEERLDAATWALYRVRRVYPARGRASRKLERLKSGSRDEMEPTLQHMARRLGAEVERTAGSLRFWTLRREPDLYPSVKEMFVAAPSDAEDKERGRFEGMWNRIFLR